MVAPAPGEDCHDQSNDQRTADAHLLWGVHRERHLCGEAEHRGLLATARPAERYQSCRCNGSGAAMTRGATLLRTRLTERCLPMPAAVGANVRTPQRVAPLRGVHIVWKGSARGLVYSFVGSLGCTCCCSRRTTEIVRLRWAGSMPRAVRPNTTRSWPYRADWSALTRDMRVQGATIRAPGVACGARRNSGVDKRLPAAKAEALNWAKAAETMSTIRSTA
jgi:hypothetical protein